MTCFMDSISNISNNIPQEVIEDTGKSNLSKNEIFNIIDKVNKLDVPQDTINSTYIRDNLLKDGKDNERYISLAISLDNEIKKNKQIKITVGLVIEIIKDSIWDYINNIRGGEGTDGDIIKIDFNLDKNGDVIKKIVTAYVLGMDILDYSGITPQNDKNIYDVDIEKDDPEEIK